jgi:nicotinamidase-related amidase
MRTELSPRVVTLSTLGFLVGGLALLVALAPAGVAATPPRTLREAYGLPPIAALDPAKTAVMVVDAQREFVGGALPLPDIVTATDRAAQLLDWARAHAIRVVHVRQIGKPGGPLFPPGGRGAQPIAALDARAGEDVVGKPTGGGFTRTDLDERLRAAGVDTVIVAGFMTHHAVDMTARDAGVRGYRVIIATDATAARDLPAADGAVLPAAEVQRAALAIAGDRFAELRSVAQLAALPLTPAAALGPAPAPGPATVR